VRLVVVAANRHDREVTTNNESHPWYVLVIPADPGSESGTGTGIQKSSLDNGVRRYDGWTFIGKGESCL